MKPGYRHLLLVTACLLSSLLAGCARSPQVNFYTLTPMARSVDSGKPPVFSVAVAPVTLPEYVDRPQLVLNSEGSRVRVLELHRWAEPLKGAIPCLLAANLSRLLATDRVSCYPQTGYEAADFRVTADFLSFVSTVDSVMLEVLWGVRTHGRGGGDIHRFKVREPLNGEGNEARVAAYSRALAALSREMADVLRKEQAAFP